MNSEEIPKGYKKTEIGIIPEDWEVKKLREIAECLDEHRIPLNEEQRKKMRGIIPYCGANGILDYVNDYTIDDDIILLAEDGGHFDEFMDKPIAYRMEGKCWVNNHAHIIKAKEDYSQDFLFYSLVHKDIRKYIGGGTRSKLNKNEMYKIEISLPPTLEEQRAIARVLSDVDKLIESLDKLIKKKKMIKKGAMQEFLTGKKRLPGFTGKWMKKRLGKILKYEQPWNHLVKTTNYCKNGFIPVLTPGKTFILGYTNERNGIYSNVPVILFDDFTTASKYVTFPFKVKSSAVKLLSLREKDYDLRFIYEKMQFIDYRISEADHKRRWISEYQYIEISLPPTLEEQQAIAKILSDMDAEIEALEKKKRKYEMLKKGMMEQLLTGKIRLLKNKQKGDSYETKRSYNS